MVGEGCLIGAHAEVRSDVKVYPYKVVEAGAQVNASIVWESGGARTLFGPEGVQGIANVDISPELAVRLAKAWASSFEKGSSITASRDTSRVARVLKRALMVGCNSVGVNVADLELATVPVTRHHVRMRGNRAGLTVRLSPDDPQSVVIRFFDERGIDLSESDQRRVERMYHREEFRRVTAGEIGDIDFSPRTIELYTADVVEAFGLRRGTGHQVKLVLDLSYGAASFVMPNLLVQGGRRRAEHQPVRADAGDDRGGPRSERGPGGRRGARFGCRPRCGHRRRGRAPDPDRRDGARAVRRRGDHGLPGARQPPAGETGRVALPVTASDRTVRRCRERGVEVILTPLSPSGLLQAAASGGVSFASDRRGGYVFPAFLPAFDAAAALARLVSLLGPSTRSLAEIVEAMPAMPILHGEVPTPMEQKGLVMRTLMEQLTDEGADLVLVDGIKVVSDAGWALVVPDPEDPVTHVWAEGSDPVSSEALVATYAELHHPDLALNIRGCRPPVVRYGRPP